jgi:hypothetical protein
MLGNNGNNKNNNKPRVVFINGSSKKKINLVYYLRSFRYVVNTIISFNPYLGRESERGKERTK